MKIVLRHFWSAWDGETARAIGAGASCGKRLDTRLMTGPMISGVHFSLGYIFGQLHLWIGVDAYRQIEPDLKFLKLEKL